MTLGSFALVSHWAVGEMQMVPPERGAAHREADTRQADTVDQLVRSNDCDVPDGVIPARAIVTVNGESRLVPSAVGFAVWLGEDGRPDTGDEAPGTIHAFCH